MLPTRSATAALLAVLLSACGGGGGGSTTSPGALPPAAPSGLMATATSASVVTLAWTGPAGTLSGYEVERATSAGGPWSQVGTPPASATGYADTGLNAGTTYSYRVRAASAAGVSGWSATASATPAVVAPSLPAAPSGLGSSPVGTSSITLTWIDNASNETGFEIERGVVAPGAGSPAIVSLIQATAANVTTYADTGLAPDTRYGYRIRAVNAVGPSAWLGYAVVTTGAPPPPAAPTGLVGVQEIVASAATIRLSWTDAATDETGYELQRSLDGVSWGATTALPANTASFVDPSPFYGTNHYQLRAVSGSGASAWVQGSAYNGPFISGYLCPQPTATSATATSNTTINVAWTWPGACSELSIERALSAGGPWAQVARVYDLLGFSPIWEDTGLTPGTTYSYRARTINSSPGWSSSAYTPVFQATTTAPPALPAPGSLAASVTSGTTASLTWSDTASGEDGFAVDFATAAAGPFTEAFRLPANSNRASVTGLTPGTAYWFRVRTVLGAQSSAPSNVVSFSTPGTGVFHATGDATVIDSSAKLSDKDRTLSTGVNSVGCFFLWTYDASNHTYLWHSCAGSALRFDTSPLAGKTVVSAMLSMFPCGLAPGPLTGAPADAMYAASALASAWNPATVTFNTLPQVYVAGGWQVPAPGAGGQQLWNVTTIVQNWASGAWVNNGLFVRQYPITDRLPTWGGVVYDYQDQTTSYCSLEQSGGSIDWVPTLYVDYQ